jgi:endoglycosylceramidase
MNRIFNQFTMKKTIQNISLIALLLTVCYSYQSCNQKSTSSGEAQIKKSEFVYIKDQKFKDPYGRDLILHGINVVNKNPEMEYVGHITPQEMATFKSWGFNVIRLGIIWDGLEPEPGQYNEEYLLKIDEMIQWAAANDLYVFLDMHQDLYSVEFSDGAPSWATITNDQPHQTGNIWSDSYLISPAVQTAFDNFWANTPAPDGVSIQDHYIQLWRHIAERYSDNTTVIGYDIMNEPFMGSGANQIMPLLLQAYAKMLVEKTGQTPPSEEELMYMWSEQRLEVLESLSDKEVYRNMIDAIYEVNAEFEAGPLTDFFQKSRNAIREVDLNHIIFIEHSYFTNMGVTGALGQIVDENGQKDNLVAYAAHGYDLVVDTKGLAAGSHERVELIFERIAETGRRLNIPVLIGEWGALHGQSPDLIPVADFLMDEFNRHGFSDAFWAYGQFLHQASFLNVLKKAYPMRTNGSLRSYEFDYDKSTLICSWKEDEHITSPTVIYIPDMDNLQKELIAITPEAESIEIEYIDESKAGYLIIPPSGELLERKLELTMKNPDNEVISLSK